MDRNLALEFVRITEAASLACARFIGQGDEKAADQAAVDAMRREFDSVDIDGTVVIGEGERDEAPILYFGEEVGGKYIYTDIYILIRMSISKIIHRRWYRMWRKYIYNDVFQMHSMYDDAFQMHCHTWDAFIMHYNV